MSTPVTSNPARWYPTDAPPAPQYRSSSLTPDPGCFGWSAPAWRSRLGGGYRPRHAARSRAPSHARLHPVPRSGHADSTVHHRCKPCRYRRPQIHRGRRFPSSSSSPRSWCSRISYAEPRNPLAHLGTRPCAMPVASRSADRSLWPRRLDLALLALKNPVCQSGELARLASQILLGLKLSPQPVDLVRGRHRIAPHALEALMHPAPDVLLALRLLLDGVDALLGVALGDLALLLADGARLLDLLDPMGHRSLQPHAICDREVLSAVYQMRDRSRQALIAGDRCVALLSVDLGLRRKLPLLGLQRLDPSPQERQLGLYLMVRIGLYASHGASESIHLSEQVEAVFFDPAHALATGAAHPRSDLSHDHFMVRLQ